MQPQRTADEGDVFRSSKVPVAQTIADMMHATCVHHVCCLGTMQVPLSSYIQAQTLFFSKIPANTNCIVYMYTVDYSYSFCSHLF